MPMKQIKKTHSTPTLPYWKTSYQGRANDADLEIEDPDGDYLDRELQRALRNARINSGTASSSSSDRLVMLQSPLSTFISSVSP